MLRLRPARKRGVIRGRSWVRTFLLRDDFTTAASAPLTSPRTAEPGPGTLTIVDTNNKLSTSGGAAQFVTGGAAVGDPGLWGAVLTRTTGRAVVAKVTPASSGFEIGWDSDQTGILVDCIRVVLGGSMIRDSVTTISTDANTLDTEYRVAIVQRSAGFCAFIKGGTFTNWTLMWVSTTSTGDQYPAIIATSTTTIGVADNFRVLDLPAPFSTDYGLATQRLSGARSAGTTFTHEANCVIELVLTTVSSDAASLVFRRQDVNNYWLINLSGTSIALYEVVATTPTYRADASITISNGDRIVVVANGTTIRAYTNNVLRFTYSSASNFATSTSGVLATLGTGGAVSDIVSWPRVMTGAAAAILDAAVA